MHSQDLANDSVSEFTLLLVKLGKVGIKGYVVCKLRLNVHLHSFPDCDLYVSWQTPEEASSSTAVLKPKTDKKPLRSGGIYFLPAG